MSEADGLGRAGPGILIESYLVQGVKEKRGIGRVKRGSRDRWKKEGWREE
jgi:hypothetical protein